MDSSRDALAGCCKLVRRGCSTGILPVTPLFTAESGWTHGTPGRAPVLLPPYLEFFSSLLALSAPARPQNIMVTIDQH